MRRDVRFGSKSGHDVIAMQCLLYPSKADMPADQAAPLRQAALAEVAAMAI